MYPTIYFIVIISPMVTPVIKSMTTSTNVQMINAATAKLMISFRDVFIKVNPNFVLE